MIRNSFDVGPEGWHSYDYHGEIVTGAGIFVLATWQREGGVNDSGFIWADQSRWSTDVPERPISILALIHYRNWVGLGPIDLRQAEVSVYLRGDDCDCMERLATSGCILWCPLAFYRARDSDRGRELGAGAEPVCAGKRRIAVASQLQQRGVPATQLWAGRAAARRCAGGGT